MYRKIIDSDAKLSAIQSVRLTSAVEKYAYKIDFKMLRFVSIDDDDNDNK